MKKYQRTHWKNYVNSDIPGTFITAEKMNNIEDAVEDMNKEIINVLKNGNIPTANIPELKTINVSSDSVHFISTITGKSEEIDLTYLVEIKGTNTPIAEKDFSIESLDFNVTLELPVSVLDRHSGKTASAYIKNKFDEGTGAKKDIIIP